MQEFVCVFTHSLKEKKESLGDLLFIISIVESIALLKCSVRYTHFVAERHISSVRHFKHVGGVFVPGYCTVLSRYVM